MKKVVVVGGMAAGCKTSARLRRLSEEFEITIVEKLPIVSFGACGMPFFVSGEVDQVEALYSNAWGSVRTPEFFLKAKNIKVLTNHECLKILPNKNEVLIRAPNGNEFTLDYDFLVIATGGKPKIPPFPILNWGKVSHFYSPIDAKKVRKLAEMGSLRSVGIIGGGFIGCELAESLTSLWGIETTIFECEGSLLSRIFDKEISNIIAKLFEENKINIQLCSKVKYITSTNDKAIVNLEDMSFEFDYVFLCLGNEPNVELAKSCGIKIGSTGGIVVNEFLQTNFSNIFAAGDCVELENIITKRKEIFALGSIANRQGRVVANTIAKIPTKFDGAVGSISLRSFETTLASAGLCSNLLNAYGIAHKSILATFYDRPHYYPENQVLFAKMNYDDSNGKLLGLQLAGKGEVVRYVEVFAELLQRQGKIDDLTKFEHCYTPPHSSPINPLNYLGYIAENHKIFGVEQISPLDFNQFDGIIVDLRTEEEIKAYPNVKATYRIPFEDFRTEASKLDKGGKILCVCQKGPRSLESAILLKNIGFEKVYYLGGGLQMLNLIF